MKTSTYEKHRFPAFPPVSLIYIQYQSQGKWKRVSTKTDKKKIALETLNHYKVEEAKEFNGLPTKHKRHTLRELVDRYLEHCAATLAPRWAHNKRLLLDKYMLPFLGESTPVKQITAARIEAYQRERLQTVKPRTVNIETHHFLLAMLRKAAEWGMIPETAIPKVKKLREEEGRLRFLSVEEIAQIRETAAQLSPAVETFVMLGLYAGLRSGEALTLRWQDVNLDHYLHL